MNHEFEAVRQAFRQRLTGAPATRGAGGGLFAASGPLGKALGVAVGVVAVVAAMAMSVVALGAILVIGTVGGAWFWWRTRDLRRQLRAEMARMQAMAGSGASPFQGQGPYTGQNADVIEGDFIREAPGQTGEREAFDASRRQG